jgi:hypothetical protein
VKSGGKRTGGRRARRVSERLAVRTSAPTRLVAPVMHAWVPYPCVAIDALGCGGARVSSSGGGALQATTRMTQCPRHRRFLPPQIQANDD